MATIIKLGGKSAKQAMLNWALRLSSQGAKREWPCKKMKVYSYENGPPVCVCVYFLHASGLCTRAKENGCVCVPRLCFHATKWSSVRVCLFVLRVCASEWEIYAGKLDIIACVCARHACTCIRGNRYILSACALHASGLCFRCIFLSRALCWTSQLSHRRNKLFLWRATVCHPRRLIIPLCDFCRSLIGCCCIQCFKITVDMNCRKQQKKKKKLSSQEPQHALCLSSSTLFLMNTDMCVEKSRIGHLTSCPCSS